MKINRCSCGGKPKTSEIYDEDASFTAMYEIRCPVCGLGLNANLPEDLTILMWNASPQKRREAMSYIDDDGAYIIMEQILTTP